MPLRSDLRPDMFVLDVARPSTNHELVGRGEIVVGMERVAPVANHVGQLRGRQEEYPELAVDDVDRDRMDPRRRALANGRQQTGSVTGSLEQPATALRHLGRGGLELGPSRHRISPAGTSMAVSRTARRVVTTARPKSSSALAGCSAATTGDDPRKFGSTVWTM